MKRVGFYLMTQRGYGVLSSVLTTFGADVVAYVVSGRNAAMIDDGYNAIAELSRRYNLPLFGRDARVLPQADLAIAAGWRRLVPDPQRLLVMHDSPLPRYRGFAPLVNMLINGETELGVTLFWASDDYDCGPIVEQRVVPITYPMTIQQALDAVTPLYGGLATTAVRRMMAGDVLSGDAQDDAGASYSLWRDEDDYEVDWALDAETLKRFVDAVGAPYKGARTYDGTQRIVIREAQAMADVKVENRTPGKVIFMREGCPVVVCGRGLLRLTRMETVEGAPYIMRKLRTRLRRCADTF